MQKFLLIVIATITSAFCFSQDANYWSSTFGPGSYILPGSVIAKNGDSGVLFYNPALLAYNNKNAAFISGNIYDLQSIKIKDAVGKGLDITSKSTRIQPVIASNTLLVKFKKKSVSIAYALFYNPVMHFSANQRRDDQINVLNDNYSPGKEVFVGQYLISNEVSEANGTFSIGTTVTSKLAAGILFDVNSRQQTFQLDSKSRALINDNSNLTQKLVNVSEFYFAKNKNIGLAVKAGLAYDFDTHHHLGFLLSLPLFHLYGKSELLTDYVINNLKFAPGIDISILANSRQTNLSSKWKTPLSMALGYTADIGRSQLYISSEYFMPIREYEVITPRNEYFIRPDTGNNSSFTASLLKLKDARKSILNVSVALRIPVKNDVTGYASFRTDFSYYDKTLFRDDDGYAVNISNWDIYHLQLGINVKKKRFNFRAGLLLNYAGTSHYDQPVNFDDPNESNFLRGTTGIASATRFGGGILMSYVYNL